MLHRKEKGSFSGSDIIGAVINHTGDWFSNVCQFVRPLASSPFSHSFHSPVTSQLLWELDSRGQGCSFGCRLRLQSKHLFYYRARCSVTVRASLKVPWNLIFLPWNLVIDVFHSAEFAVLMQSFVITPLLLLHFLWLFIQWGVYTSWAAGSRDCIDWRQVEYVLLEDRWFRPAFCGHGSVSDYILFMLQGQRENR